MVNVWGLGITILPSFMEPANNVLTNMQKKQNYKLCLKLNIWAFKNL